MREAFKIRYTNIKMPDFFLKCSIDIKKLHNSKYL